MKKFAFKNIGSKFKSLFHSIGNFYNWLLGKAKNADTKTWVLVAMWLGTFFLMFAFIGVAAGIDKADKSLYADSIASVGLVFAVCLFAAVACTVGIKFIQAKRVRSGVKA